ncbi:MAG: DUF924 family protein [Pseudomonadota bacterium]
MYNEILKFWFEDISPAMWWTSDENFDAQVKHRFLPLLQQAAQGEFYTWRNDPRGRLAEIIVLDQFSRNIYRNTPAAFAQDPMALVLAQEAITHNIPQYLSEAERGFLLLPYMHSESKKIHEFAEPLYRNLAAKGNYEFELKHKAIIDRFGRYPHRNSILGRISTDEELEFLKQPGSSF